MTKLIDSDLHIDSSFPRNKTYHYNNAGYPCRKSMGRKVSLHTEVWELANGPTPSGYTIDHINRNKLDARLNNLRLATPYQQQLNKGPSMGVDYKGVVKRGNRYRAKYKLAGAKDVHVGMYATAKEAAMAYNKAYAEAFKDSEHLPFIFLNDID